VISIFGPTGVGKTEVAEQVAQILRESGRQSVGISADALAVYREIPILTGAPTLTGHGVLNYELVGIRSVLDSFSVGEFAELAHRHIDAALSHGMTPIVVGGTGLYLRAALSDLSVPPKVDAQLRQGLELVLEKEGEAALRIELQASDPAVEQRIEPGDTRRLIRALELIRAGHPAPADPAGLWSSEPRRPTSAFALVRDRDDLRARIDARVEGMLEAGVEDEVRAADALGSAVTARAAIGFAEVLKGDFDQMKTRTWQLARRQMTWVRRLEDVRVLNLTELGVDGVVEVISGSAIDTVAKARQS
jgi:tRNA dimethylallyltransferase